MPDLQPALVIISPAFPRTEAETQWLPLQQQLAKTLQQQYPQIRIIVLSLYYPYETADYSWNGIAVSSFNGGNRGKIKHFLLWMNVWRKLTRIKKENRLIGIFSCWCGEAALMGRHFSRWNHLPHFCWICGQDAGKTNKFVKWIRPGGNELVAISHFIANEFYRNHGIKPKHIIPSAVDPKLFGEDQPERDIDILSAGSLSTLKQYEILVMILFNLKKTYPSIRAIHCGTGEERATIQQLIRNFGLEKNLSLLGEQPHSEVLKWMQRSRLFMHPSSYEGFGTVCLEALYAGAQVISFTKPINHEIKNWSIVRTPEEMQQKALELLDRKFTPEKVLVYSIEEIAGKVMGLYLQQQSLPAGPADFPSHVFHNPLH